MPPMQRGGQTRLLLPRPEVTGTGIASVVASEGPVLFANSDGDVDQEGEPDWITVLDCGEQEI